MTDSISTLKLTSSGDRHALLRNSRPLPPCRPLTHASSLGSACPISNRRRPLRQNIIILPTHAGLRTDKHLEAKNTCGLFQTTVVTLPTRCNVKGYRLLPLDMPAVRGDPHVL